MAFYNQVFPPRIAQNMEAGPGYIADQAWSQSGQRAFNLYDPLPLREYNLRHPVRKGADFEELVAFFMATRGLDPFLFKDWSDYRATLENTSLTLITGAVYQMNRIYVAPLRTSVRPIYKPAAGAMIWRTRSGSTSDITGTSTIDFDTGEVEVAGHMVGDTYRWTGAFYVPVCFADPRAVWNVIGTPGMLTEWSDLSLRESRER